MSALGSSRLTICIDFKNPHAHLANGPTWALLHELSTDAAWLPIALPPLPHGPAPSAGNDRGTRHRRRRAEYVEHDLQRYARVRGLALVDPYRNPDVTLASLGLLSLENASADIRERYVTSVFDGYWRGMLDLEDRAALEDKYEAAGGDGAELDRFIDGPGRARLSQVAGELAEAGIFSTPAYVIDGETYYGRAHLPMIRWLLTDRNGPPPL